MKKFAFRLQKVLEFRESAEDTARTAYLDARAQRIEAEAFLGTFSNWRHEILRERIETVEDRLALERALCKIDTDERAQQTVIRVLTDEEGAAMVAWKEKKIELETIVKLKEKALEEYRQEVARKEQAELDEWSSMRRTG